MFKKILSFFTQKEILVGGLLIALLLTPLAHASAQAPTMWGGATTPPPEEDSGACWSWTTGITVSNCIALALANTANFALMIAAKLVWVASSALNYVLSIQGVAFHDQAIVNVGWQIARDVANLFYIFFLLIIAISMILGFSSYGSKQTLVKLLISAVFVNFSLPLTGLVIDASNAIGYTFYNQMGSVDPNLANSTNAPYNRDIGAALAEGFNPQNAVMVNNSYFSSGRSTTAVLLDILLSGIVGTILMIIMAFSLFAGAFLLMIRIISLWVVLVFSPIAFASLANQKTEGLIFNKWSNALFQQSFFFPAYMFMLYLVVTAVSGGVVTAMFQQGNNALYGTAAAGEQMSAWLSKPNLLLGFIFIAMLTIGSLTVAGEMGAQGKNIVNQWRSKGQKWAARQARRPVDAAYRTGKRAVGTVAGAAGAAAVASRIPIAKNMGAAAVRFDQRQKEEQAKRESERAKYLTPREKAIMARGMMSAGGVESIWKGMKPKERQEFLKEYTRGDKNEQSKFADKLRLATRDEGLQKKYNQQVAVASGDLTSAMQILGHGDKSPEELRAAKHNFLVDMEDDDRKAFLSPNALKSDIDIQTYVSNNFTLGDLRKYADSSDKLKAYSEIINNPQFAQSSLVKRVGSSPSKTIIQQKLASGERLTEADTGTQKKKKEEEKKSQEGEQKVAGEESAGGGARSEEEQKSREEILKETGNSTFS